MESRNKMNTKWIPKVRERLFDVFVNRSDYTFKHRAKRTRDCHTEFRRSLGGDAGRHSALRATQLPSGTTGAIFDDSSPGKFFTVQINLVAPPTSRTSDPRYHSNSHMHDEELMPSGIAIIILFGIIIISFMTDKSLYPAHRS